LVGASVHAGELTDTKAIAEQGHAIAHYNLGVKYDRGEGVPQDYVEAVKWYRKAAEQGHANAQVNLAIQYMNNHGQCPDGRLHL